MKLPLILLILFIAFSGFTSCKSLKKSTTKIDNSKEFTLTDCQWELVKLDGQWISELNSKPFIIFEKEENRVHGNTGCNNFFGNYELKDKSKVSFSQIGMTKKACIGNTIEAPFVQVLESAKEYKIRADSLLLLKDSRAILAIFVQYKNP